MNSTELKHYGILGMKWGVRRTPEQLGRRTIKKGTVMYRTTASSTESTDGSKYVSYLEVDRDTYKGNYGNVINRRAGKRATDSVYEHKFVLKEDLKLPSRDELRVLYEKIGSDKKYRRAEAERQALEIANRCCGNYKSYKDFISNTSEQNQRNAKDFIKYKLEQFEQASPDQMFDTVAWSLGGSPKVKAKVIDELKKKGYNAMVDEAGVGGITRPRDGYDPLIIFDGTASLQPVKTSEIKYGARRAAAYRSNQWFKTANSPMFAKNTW